MSKRIWVLLTGAGLWMLFIVACLAFKSTSAVGVSTKLFDDYPPLLAVSRSIHAGAELIITQTVGTDSGQCATTTSVVVQSGKSVYFCLTILNRGDVALTSLTIKQVNSVISAQTVSITQP